MSESANVLVLPKYLRFRDKVDSVNFIKKNALGPPIYKRGQSKKMSPMLNNPMEKYTTPKIQSIIPGAEIIKPLIR